MERWAPRHAGSVPPAERLSSSPPAGDEAEHPASSPALTRHASRRPTRRVLIGAMSILAGAVVLGASVTSGEDRPDSPRPSPEVPLTAMDKTVGPANNSPTLVADPDDPEFVVMANRLDAPDFSCALQVSGDGGRSWAPVNPVPELPEGAEKCYAPEVAFDRDGVLHYLYVGLHTAGNLPMGAFITTSADRGRTFTAPRQVLGPLKFAVRMAIDPELGRVGRIHLVWIEANSDPPLGGFPPPPNPILAAYSDDGGRTFSEPVQVNDAERLRVVAPALVTGPGHRVHVAYYDLEDDAVDYQGLEGPVWEGAWSVILATSADGGGGFDKGTVVDASVVPPERVMLIFTMAPPALAVNGSRMCVAWTDGRHGDRDVLARCSQDRGQRWDPTRRLNDDKVGNGLDQFMPRLAFSPEGRLDAVFYDRRRHPQNVLNYVFLTYSTDGGQTWSPNVRLTRHASNSQIGQRYANVSAKGQVEFGSRMGLISSRRSAVVAWADTRNSDPFTTGQDVFTTVVRLPSGATDGRSSVAVATGVLLVLVGMLTVLSSRRGRHSRLPLARKQ